MDKKSNGSLQDILLSILEGVTDMSREQKEAEAKRVKEIFSRPLPFSKQSRR
jgi:hypothetical protein